MTPNPVILPSIPKLINLIKIKHLKIHSIINSHLPPIIKSIIPSLLKGILKKDKISINFISIKSLKLTPIF